MVVHDAQVTYSGGVLVCGGCNSGCRCGGRVCVWIGMSEKIDAEGGRGDERERGLCLCGECRRG